MELHEFSWEPTQTDEGEGHQLDIRLTRMSNGSYRVTNLKSPEQTFECGTATECQDAFKDLIEKVPTS